MLPMPEYSHPKGPLNLVSYLRDNSVKPDLGPKSYVAFGRCAHTAAACLPLPAWLISLPDPAASHMGAWLLWLTDRACSVHALSEDKAGAVYVTMAAPSLTMDGLLLDAL